MIITDCQDFKFKSSFLIIHFANLLQYFEERRTENKTKFELAN